MELTFWGTFGSIPRPLTSKDLVYPYLVGTSKTYGGNTTCLEVRPENGEVYIFDGGTGIRDLGADLMKRGYAPGQDGHAKIFLTHEHWDHIQGLPFFVPAYFPTNHFTIHGESKVNLSLKEILSGQMNIPYFPVPLDLQKGMVEFIDLVPGQIVENGITINSMQSNHPNGSLIYSIQEGKSKVVFATDYEHDGAVFGKKFGPHDVRLIEFAQGADLLVFDGQYRPEQYRGMSAEAFDALVNRLEKEYADPKTDKKFADLNFGERGAVLSKELRTSKVGWGHSTYEAAINIGRAAGAGEVMLTHHDPAHSDADLDALYSQAATYLRKVDPRAELAVSMAYDGLTRKI